MDKDWWHGFFGMTRTERIGAYAMLVIMTLTVTIAFTFRSCSPSDSDVGKAREVLKRSEMAQQMQDSIYKAKVDSANVEASIKKNAKKYKKAKKHKRIYEDRDLQEVPQY
ncbi:MAG: hypothetical protein ACI30V_01240 [Muribaculaceae bacterium]